MPPGFGGFPNRDSMCLGYRATICSDVQRWSAGFLRPDSNYFCAWRCKCNFHLPKSPFQYRRFWKITSLLKLSCSKRLCQGFLEVIPYFPFWWVLYFGRNLCNCCNLRDLWICNLHQSIPEMKLLISREKISFYGISTITIMAAFFRAATNKQHSPLKCPSDTKAPLRRTPDPSSKRSVTIDPTYVYMLPLFANTP